jgi:hypothetical protein
VVGQIGLFSRAQIAGMRDRTKRRNYSEEAEEFRRDHARRRKYGLAQRHAQKLTHLYGSPAKAEAAIRRENEEARAARSRAREAAAALPGSARPEVLASAADRPAPVGLKSIRSEPVRARPEINGCGQRGITQAEPQTSGPAQTESAPADPQANGPTQTESAQTPPEIGGCGQVGPRVDECAQAGPEQDGPEAGTCEQYGSEQSGSEQARPEASGSTQVESAQVSPHSSQGEQIDPESGGPGPGERVPIGPERVENQAGVIDSSGRGRNLSGKTSGTSGTAGETWRRGKKRTTPIDTGSARRFGERRETFG